MDGSNFTVEVINTPMIFNGLSCVLSSFFKVDPIWSEIVVKERDVNRECRERERERAISEPQVRVG